MNGSTLAKLLSDADLPAAWLARRLGVATSTVTRWLHPSYSAAEGRTIRDPEVPTEYVEQIEGIFAAPLRDLPKR